ncbi:restriction endonuclease subunit S [Phocaeicola vulgatus]|uniref:restriction endonuclease subunit S n=1 Tax=Phocaeicola vulgatus TaxID=821 RepID=UPI0001F44271|nr:restriction endonuclease subunit S [Phocaeicola vulgatus]EFV66463.1 type I restriction enzyme EcoAI specificity protein [Bacteroides sp. 3_1_40A]KAB3670739.1 restriction endonuclease subunit S [Phocaeicola vulgatus]MCE9035895.1 restriction endonuclease subunit S [Phocaeicola vulgatus]MCS2447498.1 restriction endonuclease subunit S [Phocaeicola vulgatus]MDC1622215.1 restriction endonuclease subunit S [Phocaeicola vulgatus]
MSNTWFRLRRGFFLSFFPSDTPHYPYLLPNGWEWCNLEDIVCELKYGTSEKSLSVGKIAVLRMGNITNVGTIDYSNLVYSSNNEDIKLYSLEKDDLLFNRTNSSEWVGKTAIYKKEQPAIYAGYLIRIRPILIFSDYLNTVMNSSYYRNWCYNVKTDAVNQSNINAQKLSQLMIPIPPLKEQERIVVEVAKWISLINTIKNSKEDLQTTIKQAKSKILNLAIHGKLVPQDPNDEPAIELLKRINPDFTPCDNGHYTQLPEGWAICKMKQITSITNGKSQKNVETLNGIYPIYGSGGVIGRANQYLCIAGSTIIGRKGTINNPIFVEEHFWNVDTAFGLKANDAILDKYLYYFCLSFDFSKLDKSTAMPSLTKTSIGNVLIPIPPYKEQERIVAKIDMVLDTMNEILRAV